MPETPVAPQPPRPDAGLPPPPAGKPPGAEGGVVVRPEDIVPIKVAGADVDLITGIRPGPDAEKAADAADAAAGGDYPIAGIRVIAGESDAPAAATTPKVDADKPTVVVDPLKAELDEIKGRVTTGKPHTAEDLKRAGEIQKELAAEKLAATSTESTADRVEVTAENVTIEPKKLSDDELAEWKSLKERRKAGEELSEKDSIRIDELSDQQKEYTLKLVREFRDALNEAMQPLGADGDYPGIMAPLNTELDIILAEPEAPPPPPPPDTTSEPATAATVEVTAEAAAATPLKVVVEPNVEVTIAGTAAPTTDRVEIKTEDVATVEPLTPKDIKAWAKFKDTREKYLTEREKKGKLKPKEAEELKNARDLEQKIKKTVQDTLEITPENIEKFDKLPLKGQKETMVKYVDKRLAELGSAKKGNRQEIHQLKSLKRQLEGKMNRLALGGSLGMLGLLAMLRSAAGDDEGQ